MERQGGLCWSFSPQENLFVWLETWAQKTVLVFILKEEKTEICGPYEHYAELHTN